MAGKSDVGPAAFVGPSLEVEGRGAQRGQQQQNRKVSQEASLNQVATNSLEI